MHTYHCFCTQLVLASTKPLSELEVRKSDGSLICPLVNLESALAGPSASLQAVLQSTSLAPKAIVVQSEDGYEKRWEQRCQRCSLTIGYHLDHGQFGGDAQTTGRREDVIYLLPGGLLGTDEMSKAPDMSPYVNAMSVRS